MTEIEICQCKWYDDGVKGQSYGVLVADSVRTDITTFYGVPKTKALTLQGIGRAEFHMTGMAICEANILRKWVIKSLGNDTTLCLLLQGIARRRGMRSVHNIETTMMFN